MYGNYSIRGYNEPRYGISPPLGNTSQNTNRTAAHGGSVTACIAGEVHHCSPLQNPELHISPPVIKAEEPTGICHLSTRQVKHQQQLHHQNRTNRHNYIQGARSDFPVPVHSKYQSQEARVASFKGHEKNFPYHTPSEMSDAGFFYKNHPTGDASSLRDKQQSADVTYCFKCDLGIEKWEVTDIPWVEHARHTSGCGYVNAEMGPKFVKDIKGSFTIEKQFRESCDPHTKDSPLLFVENFRKQKPEVYAKLYDMYNKREGMCRVEKAIIHWYFTVDLTGKNPPRASNIISLLNDQKAESASASASASAIEESYKKFVQQRRVSLNECPEHIRDQLTELEKLKEERASIFQRAENQRQKQKTEAGKIQESKQKSPTRKSEILEQVQVADKKTLILRFRDMQLGQRP